MSDWVDALRTKIADVLAPEIAEQRKRITARRREQRTEARELFLELWSTARDCPDYDKKKWARLQVILADLRCFHSE